ncbi:MAG: hypothetical protein E7016_04390 [Alphaproteobacteria bacterium]|nr:hypothetical protein [Alphaproteobacteria bacterium]
MQNENILSQIKDTEQKFKANDYKGNSLCSCVVKKYGDLPILLSAPHAVKQIRNGEIKAHEFYTGAIVECLAKQIGCACITKQYLIENTTNDDPNTDNAYCSYKTAINQFLQEHKIKLFVDIHGLSSKRDSIVDICIDKGKNVNDMTYVSTLQKCIENKFGVNTSSIDKYFSAFSDNIMSKWIHSNFDVSAIELEINGAYRWFEGDTEKQSLDLFFCLQNWLTSIPF